MEPWYDLADVYRDRNPKEPFGSWRIRMAYRHARYVRHLDVRGATGRPRRVSLITYAGLQAIYHDAPVPRFVPYPVPLRLTDAARQYIVEGTLYSTSGIEPDPQHLERDAFFAFVKKKGIDELVEPDFLPL